MNHQILWAAIILGSFIMQAVSRIKDEHIPCFMWNLVSVLALMAGMVL